ncbi:MAG: phosphoserine aminotransferase, partial [Bacteroidota bacterium]
GLDRIREESQQKAKLLYDFFEQDERFSLFVENQRLRSETVIVANTNFPAPELIEFLDQKDFVVGSGYRERKKDQIRVANFPAVSIADVERLIHTIREF